VRKVELATLALLAIVCSAPCRGAQFDIGISGGSLSLGAGVSIAVPDTFIVTAAQHNDAGVFVIARREYGSPARQSVVSELWLFPNGEPGQPAPTFADRRVLLSFNSHGGESTEIITRIVCCRSAAAIGIDGWESASMVLFDSTGARIDIAPGAIESACDCEVNYLRPLTWIMFGPEMPEHYELICEAGAEGGMWTYLVRYNLDNGQITVHRALDAVGEIGDAILRHFKWRQ
jgi:hypothetical protein